MNLRIYNDKPSSSTLAASFAAGRVLEKVRALDGKARRKGLAALDARRNPLIGIGMETAPGGRVTKNGYGVFHLSWLAEQNPQWPAQVRAELDEIRLAIHAAHGVPLRFLIWAGMGGSAEDKSMYNAAGLLGKGPRCYVLDSTDPAKLKAILADIARRSGGRLDRALRSTLVAGMALGMTSYEPVVNLEKLAALYARHNIDSRANFIYLTLPGSILEQFAAPRGYRRVELQLDGGNSTSGRHSGPLTRGSLYPLGLAGVDLDAWFRGTFLTPARIETAFQLAAFLHQQGLAGRDKVAWLPAPSLAAAALWTKQNFEESLGKSEALGVKIVIGEQPRLAHYRSMKSAGQDRVFVAVQRHGERHPEAARIQRLRTAGYPLAVLTVPAAAPLSFYMQAMHYAVFGMGWLRGMNFVTQPGVELYKALTSVRTLDADWKKFAASPRQLHWRGGLILHLDRLPGAIAGTDAAGVYAALLARHFAAGAAEYGELTFFGDTRYSPRGRALRRVLDRAGASVFRQTLRRPVDVYEGPAMNHSYHEMIIGHGRCFSTVLLSRTPAAIPEANYTADYHRAQFLATQRALAERGRAVAALTLPDLEPASLAALAAFFTRVAALLKKARAGQ